MSKNRHSQAQIVEALMALEVDTSFSSRRVTRVLERVAAERGTPLHLRSDKGPELTSRHYLVLAARNRLQVFPTRWLPH